MTCYPYANLYEYISNQPELSTLTLCVNTVNLEDALSGLKCTTLFAPTNAAFDALPDGTLPALLANPDLLTNILLYHLTGKKLCRNDLTNGKKLKMLNQKCTTVCKNCCGTYLVDNLKRKSCVDTNNYLMKNCSVAYKISKVLLDANL